MAAAPPGAAAAAPAASAQTLVGTWRGTLRVPPTGKSGTTYLQVVLRFDDDGGGLKWQLARADRSEPVIGRGSVEGSADGVRMTGTHDQEQPDGLGGTLTPRVKVTYNGTITQDAFDATGLTDDRRVYALSVRRVVP